MFYQISNLKKKNDKKKFIFKDIFLKMIEWFTSKQFITYF